ncbi:MAG: RNA polymerase sigma factor [Nitrospinota bacterium]
MKPVRKNIPFPNKDMSSISADEAVNASSRHIQAEDFLRAYDKYASSLFRYALFRVSSKETAQDLVAQTFFQVWQFLQKKEELIRNWKVFLYRTLSNLIVDVYRRKHLEPILMDETNETNPFEFIDEKHLPKNLNRKVEAQLILESFQELPSEQKDILLWRYVEDLSIADIASLTGKKKSAVYVNIHRALQKIKKLKNTSK